MIQEYLNSIDNFIVVGDRVLIKPREMETHTRSGLVLPASVKERGNSKRIYFKNWAWLPNTKHRCRRGLESIGGYKIYWNASIGG